VSHFEQELQHPPKRYSYHHQKAPSRAIHHTIPNIQKFGKDSQSIGASCFNHHHKKVVVLALCHSIFFSFSLPKATYMFTKGMHISQINQKLSIHPKQLPEFLP